MMKYLYRNNTKLKLWQNAKRFETVIELDNWASKIWEDWELQYINDIRNPIAVYCGHGARHGINEYYRSGKQKFTELSELAEELERILENAPRLPEDIVTYRVVEKAEVNKLLNKGEVKDYGFISTTPYLNHEENIKGCKFFEIFVPKGTICAYVEHLSVRQEYELLLAASNYKIVYSGKKYKKKGSTFYKCVLN